MPIANCPQCNKVFRQQDSALCPECQHAAMDNISVVYRYTLEHPGEMLETIAQNCGLSVNVLEGMLASGSLGTATSRILCQCQQCAEVLPATHRKGRFCPTCAKKVGNSARLSEKEHASKKTNSPSTLRGTRVTSGNEAEDSGTVADVPVEGCNASLEREKPVTPKTGHYGFKRNNLK